MTIKDFYIFCCDQQTLQSNISAVYIANAGSPEFNGTYTNSGLIDQGKPIFINQTGIGDLYGQYYGSSWRWEIYSSSIRYYYSNEADWPWLATQWYQDSGASPVPIIL